jgi:hypothetical protein
MVQSPSATTGASSGTPINRRTIVMSGKMLAMAVGGCALAAGPLAAQAAESSFDMTLELGATFQQRNDVKIPNDNEGTRFSLEDLAGNGPWATARINANWNFGNKHGLRLVLAPLAYTETGRFDTPVKFAGKEFQPDSPVKASYRFNSWRIGYRYHFYENNNWQLWVGGTLKVRDAEIKLSQGGSSSRDDDVGVVPLLYFAAEYRFNDQWLFEADFDGLAGGPGRAFDISAKVSYEPGDRWRFGLGYRGLEGGVDSDDVYNFAWFNTAFLSVNYRF